MTKWRRGEPDDFAWLGWWLEMLCAHRTAGRTCRRARIVSEISTSLSTLLIDSSRTKAKRIRQRQVGLQTVLGEHVEHLYHHRPLRTVVFVFRYAAMAASCDHIWPALFIDEGVISRPRQEQPPTQRTGCSVGNRVDAHPDLAVRHLA
jgi:hypothetical protein